MEEKVVREERVFDGKLVKVNVYDVTTPDGQTHRREVVAHPGAVGMVALDAGDVLMVRQYRLATEGTLLEIPAGTLEPDEAPIVTAERELQEEIGYKPGTLTPMGGIYVAPGYSSEYLHLYLATDLSASSLDGDADEFIDVVRMPFARALDMAVQGQLHDGKTIAGLLQVARYLGV